MSVTANLTTNVETITATIVVEDETIIAEINTAARGPAGGGTGSIDSTTTSDGTADLDLLNVDTVTATVTGTLTADHIHGNLAGNVYGHIRAGETLEKGDPVYVSGSHGSGSTLIPIVSKADASNAAKMPAIGIMDAGVTIHNNGHMVIVGTITELDTAGLTVNAELYVAAGGGMTGTPPTARAQPVARVERVNANNGAVIVKVNGLSASDATANTLVRRTANGDATFGALNTSSLTVTGGTTFGEESLVQFDAIEYYYGTGAASAHRIALGGVGDSSTGTALFGAADVKAANETLLRTTKIKTTQTDRTLSTAYTTDSDFTVAVAAGKTYRVEFLFITTATSNSGWKGQFTIPSVPTNITTTANSIGIGNAPGGGNVGSIGITIAGVIGAALLQRATVTNNGTYSGFFEVTIGTTGGNLLFQWGQFASHADNSSLLANSVVTVIERTP